ncbi:MAG TPA: aminomethyl-transferring glycine dehydrogenase subunit GcvPA [Gammaproteobacteria bacterium]|nr:aminomethyl-transferring glycine dehydrogenase [Gammaproteobacteria bacterium]MEC8010627.1 aminomethyl-transferring glycine dehydrogenase subunit GcvPA [Pseudomonadota bacterium]HBF07432.1 aminomethyl-transferring glycine dehydrogenase subunit GcvPA [Gammaproteobacteria bacterium]HCK91601.1 aminomethyl-transferring glycine dehydrogenase subunit GcvPA [Gammaproteobacteria bacterium]|tara:strand:+ start:675 stop:2033 length:1359 start_codon:yes stop_codon:yes gene_type:complete
MSFTPHTEQDIQEMLATIGVSDISDLFDEIPASLKGFDLTIPNQQSEQASSIRAQALAEMDKPIANYIGAGAYEHYIPAAVWDIVGRGEFMTAYTPYQAEASQGTLQVIFEYQTMMTQLTGMDVSNASMYDGATALAEAVLMSVRAAKKARNIIVPKNLHPHYREVVRNLTHAQKIQLIEVDFTSEGTVDLSALKDIAADGLAALIISQPNFFGSLEDVDALTDWAHEQGALTIGVVNPTSLAVIKQPGQWGQAGADIVVGDGQPLGVPLSGGGPYFGFMCCTQKLVRQMPGRIIGQTVDLDGRTGYALTLQAREQHIRRSKATSNICTNQGLAVTAATIYMSILGAEGLEQVATQSMLNTRKLVNGLTETGVAQAFGSHFLYEVALKLPMSAEAFVTGMLEHGIDPGLPLSRYFADQTDVILVCATETKTQDHLDAFIAAATQVIAANGGK